MLGAGIGCDTQGSSSSGPPRVSQPFGEDEHWSLLAAAAPEEAGWDTAINIVGSGDTIDAISIFSFGVLPDAGSTQLARGAQDPAGTVTFDGKTLHVQSQFQVEGTGEECSVDLTATVTGLRSDAWSASGGGVVTAGYDEFAATPEMVLRRSLPCDSVLAWEENNLEGTRFTLSNSPCVVPDLLPFGLPVSGEVLEIVWSDPAFTGWLGVFPEWLGVGGADEYDLAGPADGTSVALSFDGETFSIEAEGTYEGATTNGVAETGEFTIHFTGTVTHCWVSAVDAGGAGEQNLRVDGTGSYGALGQEWELTTVYLR